MTAASYRCPLGYTWQEADVLGAHVARRAGYLLTQEADALMVGATANVPFYPGQHLLRVRKRDWPDFYACYYLLPRQGFAMPEKGDWVRLNSASAPLHKFNERQALDLRAEHAAAYLRFFCFFVHGDGGAFALVESADDPLTPPDVPAEMRRVFETSARPVIFEGKDKYGRYLLSAIVWYGFRLYLARFAVVSNGEVDMIDDDPIAADLPLDPAWRVD